MFVCLKADPPARMLEAVADREARVFLEVWAIHRLEEEVVELQTFEVHGIQRRLGKDELELVPPPHHEIGPRLRADTDPIDSVGHGQGPVGLDRDLEVQSMESINEISVQLEQWLSARPGLRPETVQQVAGDASFRSYYRVETTGGPSLIVMDAPPEHEDCRPFIDVTQRLESAGVHVPHIHAEDPEQGFLLLEYLGDVQYLDRLKAAGYAREDS